MAAKIKEYHNDLGELVGAEIWFKDGFYAAYGDVEVASPDEELHENIEVNFEPNVKEQPPALTRGKTKNNNL